VQLEFLIRFLIKTITVTVGNAVPEPSSIEYVNAAYATETNFNPDDTTIYGINTTISDDNTIADIANITWYFYENGNHSTDYNTTGTTGYDLIWIRWNESSDSWSISQGALTLWTLQSPVDPGAASGLSSFEFTARFDISKVAYADTDWNVTVEVYDDTGAWNTTVAGSFVQMNNYFEIAWSVNTFAWGSVTALSTNNTMSANRTVDYYNNAQAEFVLNGSDFTAGGEADEDLETQNMVMWDEDGVEGGTNNFWLRNTQQIGNGTWDNFARKINGDASPSSLTIHLWFNETGDLTPDIEYSITVWVELRANT
jgi:hypothetical protein